MKLFGTRYLALACFGIALGAGCSGEEPAARGDVISLATDVDGDWDIMVIHLSSQTGSLITHNGANDWAPSLSPDGEWIVYASNYADGEMMDLEMLDSEGNPVRITGEATGAWDLYVMPTAGGDPVQLTDTVATEDQPAWSPDGSRIAFQSERDYGTEIYLMDADGTSVTQITYSSGNNWSPAWSPDGTLLAFSSDRTGDWEIYVMVADGTNTTQITRTPSTDIEPVWSPDGTNILFASNRRGPQELFTIPSAGGDPKPLGQVGLPSHWIRG